MWRLLGCAMALTLIAFEAQAQFRLPFIGEREEAPASVLETLDDEEIVQRCAAAQEKITEEGAEQYDLFDLYDSAVGAPEAAKLGVATRHSPRTDASLDRLLHRLVAAGPQPNPEVAVNLEEATYVDARQSSPGQILITAGLMNAIFASSREVSFAQRETELAFVLAHEYAHVLLCHHNRGQAMSRNRRALRTTAGLGVLVAVYGNSSTTRAADGTETRTTDEEDAVEDIGSVFAAMTLLRTFNSAIVNPAWGRQQERAADLLAIELMHRAGFQDTAYVTGVLPLLRRADDETTNSATQIVARLPGEALRAWAVSMNQQNSQRSFRERLQAFGLNAGIRAFQEWRTNQLRHFHDDPERRITWIEAMAIVLTGDQALPENNAFAAAGNQSIAVVAATRNNAEAEALFVGYLAESRAPDLAREATRLFAAKDIEGGCAAAQQALTAGPTSAQARYVSGVCELERHNFPRAARHFEVVLSAPNATPEDFAYIGSLWAQNSEHARAQAALFRGRQRFGEDRFYVARMYLHATAGEHASVETVATECATNSRIQEIKDACASTARELAPTPANQPGFNPIGAITRAVTGQRAQPAQPAGEGTP
jgi:Peptidase family M48